MIKLNFTYLLLLGYLLIFSTSCKKQDVKYIEISQYMPFKVDYKDWIVYNTKDTLKFVSENNDTIIYIVTDSSTTIHDTFQTIYDNNKKIIKYMLRDISYFKFKNINYDNNFLIFNMYTLPTISTNYFRIYFQYDLYYDLSGFFLLPDTTGSYKRNFYGPDRVRMTFHDIINTDKNYYDVYEFDGSNKIYYNQAKGLFFYRFLGVNYYLIE